MNPDEKTKIVKALEDRKAALPCPRCGSRSFTLVDGYFNQSIQPAVGGGLVIGGPAIPSVVVVCTQCGFMAQHALGVLGLMPHGEPGAGTTGGDR
jgi:ribosomal protein S27AE